MGNQISDIYVVESLLQSTEARPDPLRWRQVEQSGYAATDFVAQIGMIRITLNNVPGITGSRLWLTLSDEQDGVHLQEPEPAGLLGRTYRSEDDRRLAGALKQLRRAVAQQCRQRESRAAAEAGAVRERILNQLLFGRPGLQPGD